MSRLDAAYRRATPEGGRNQGLVIDVAPDIPYDRAAGRRSVLELEPQVRVPSNAAHLASLAQTLDLHPSKLRTVAFVSSGRREGTTTCVANVGRYLAQHHAKVLMVDANTRWPGLHTLARVNRTRGLLDVVGADADVRTVVQSTSVPTLFVLSSGGDAEGDCPGPLLLPSVLRERLFNRTCDYDFVLVDCPAIHECEDAAITAAACDAVILVVEGGRTLREEAQAAKALLTRAHAKILGVFMNKRRFYVPKFLYDRL